jgi:hypothetical protein
MELHRNGVEHSIIATYQHCYTALKTSSTISSLLLSNYGTATSSTAAAVAADTIVAKALQAVVVLF